MDLRSRLRKFFGMAPPVQWGNTKPTSQPPIMGVTHALLRDIQASPPGTLKVFADADDNRFIIMNEDDFEHILSLAGLRSVQQDSASSNESISNRGDEK